MKRRCFIATFAGGISCAGQTAQPKVQIRRIGFLSPGVLVDPSDEEWFWSPLGKLGWVENQNLKIERRYAGGRAELLPGMAEELVRIKVELIVALGTVAGIAAKRVTGTVPIVVHRAGDPVRTGLAASLARPGGNVTGTSAYAELDLKRIELLREVLPGITRVGELFYSLNPTWKAGRQEKERAYRSRGMNPIWVEVTQASELESAVMEIGKRAGQVLLIGTEPLFFENAEAILQAAQRLSLPVMSASAGWVGAGVLMGFGPSEEEYQRTLASIVDKVLRGTNPAELPFQQPTRFELAVDLKVAKALGVNVPQSVLIRADEVLR